MHIQQPVQLVLGLVTFPLGFVGIAQVLRHVFARTFKNRYGDWWFLSLSLWFLAGGPAHFFRAFDLRYHDSHTTSILETIEAAVLCVILIVNVIAWIIRRRSEMEASVTEAAHPAA